MVDRSRGINNAAQQFTSNIRFGNERDLSLIPLSEYHTYSRKGENRSNNSPPLLEDREAKWTKRNEIRLCREEETFVFEDSSLGVLELGREV